MKRSTELRIAGYVLAVAVVLVAGIAVGAWIGPTVTQAQEDPAPIGEGVVAAEDGYRLVPVTSLLDPSGGRFEFRIEDQRGAPITEYEELHERALHLIVVSRDLTEFHHVHPAIDEAGTWSVDLPALPPGSYRAITDFWVTGGPRLALGVDLLVPGADDGTAALPSPTTSEVDGYEVTIETATGSTGEMTAVLTVRRDGRIVQPEPYLGANGHLVALRAGDIAYAHVHPDEDGAGDGDGSDGSSAAVRFEANLDSAGRYGLFFDFRHGGSVHTATFTFEQTAVTDPVEMEMS